MQQTRVRLADPGTRAVGLLPPRWATTARALDHGTGRQVGIVVFHLVPGAQARGAYRSDRPRTTARHRAEAGAVRRAVDALGPQVDEVWAMGDSNFHGFALPGLTSAWAGRPGTEGTLGSYRRIDDVFAARPPERLTTFVTESDHRSVAAEYGERGEPTT